MLSHLILGLLRHGGPRHGYALMTTYRATSGREINVGNFYREFQRLKQDGLIRPAQKAPEADTRRVPYEITARGVAEFDDWLMRPGAAIPVDYENEYSLRAFFVLQSAHPLAQRALDHWFDELTVQQRHFQAAREEALRACRVIKNGSLPALLPLWLGRRLDHLAVDLEFIAALRAACRSRTPGRSVTPAPVAPARTAVRTA